MKPWVGLLGASGQTRAQGAPCPPWCSPHQPLWPARSDLLLSLRLPEGPHALAPKVWRGITPVPAREGAQDVWCSPPVGDTFRTSSCPLRAPRSPVTAVAEAAGWGHAQELGLAAHQIIIARLFIYPVPRPQEGRLQGYVTGLPTPFPLPPPTRTPACESGTCDAAAQPGASEPSFPFLVGTPVGPCTGMSPGCTGCGGAWAGAAPPGSCIPQAGSSSAHLGTPSLVLVPMAQPHGSSPDCGHCAGSPWSPQ